MERQRSISVFVNQFFNLVRPVVNLFLIEEEWKKHFYTYVVAFIRTRPRTIRLGIIRNDGFGFETSIYFTYNSVYYATPNAGTAPASALKLVSPTSPPLLYHPRSWIVWHRNNTDRRPLGTRSKRHRSRARDVFLPRYFL